MLREFSRRPSRLTRPSLPLLLQITVLDGRELVGDFVCLDKQGNIILHQAVEKVEIDGRVEEKFMGQILVPAQQRAACEVEVVATERAGIEHLIASTLAGAAAPSNSGSS